MRTRLPPSMMVASESSIAMPAEMRSIVLPRTSTSDGTERLGLVPSKMRTFRNRVVASCEESVFAETVKFYRDEWQTVGRDPAEYQIDTLSHTVSVKTV